MTNVTINTKNVNYEVPVEQVMHKITYSGAHSLLNDQTRVIFWTGCTSTIAVLLDGTIMYCFIYNFQPLTLF